MADSLACFWPEDVPYDDVQLCKINISQEFKED